MQPKPNQVTKSKEVFNMLKAKKYCVLQGEVRSGKTLTAILALSYSKTIRRILILTKKKPIPGIIKFTENEELKLLWPHQTHTVLNYEAIGSFKTRDTHKVTGKKIKPVSEPHLKINPNDYDLSFVL